ncbi:MAG: hypothetical protein J6K15_02445 [Lachnospiraceae bacterium]|nr:hypothetical protein [Lachnospiraceae bacterium]
MNTYEKETVTNINEANIEEPLLSEQEAREYVEIQKDILQSYVNAEEKHIPAEEWLPVELEKYLPYHPKEEIKAMSHEILESQRITAEKQESLREALAAGQTKESWLEADLKRTTSHMAAQEQAKYFKEIDACLKEGNENMRDTILTKAGVVNQNMNLDGFIAEQHHARTFNANAKAQGSDLHAEVLKPKPGERYGKNSVDVVIKDSNGKIVSRYQVKYGATAEDTIRMIKEGDYRGQQIIVPEDQVEAVQKAFPDRKVSSTISNGKTKSNPMSKEEAKKQQEQAQKNGNFLEMDYSSLSTKDIVKSVSKNVGIAAAQTALMSAGANVASQLIQGEPIDGEEVIETAITSGADSGVKTAAAAGIKIASEKGLIKFIPKGTPADVITNIATIGVENVKIAGQIATGDLTPREGLDAMEQTTASCIAGIAAGAKGAAIGAKIGAVFGPVGIAVGTFVGNVVGNLAGSTVGRLATKGLQMVRDVAVGVVKTAWEGVKAVGRGICNFFSSAVSTVAGWFGW